MAYDGIAVANTVRELNGTLLSGSITKIAQPERDELLLTIKNQRKNRKLCISASASLPLVCFKDDNTLSPLSAPNFCMTLRKHIGGGRIKRIYQPGRSLAEEGLERIIAFEIEHLDEMGDLTVRILLCELMGKHSNIVLLREDGTIIDSIKHVTPSVSSVREVLPGRAYFIPDTQGKENPLRVVFGGGKAAERAEKTEADGRPALAEERDGAVLQDTGACTGFAGFCAALQTFAGSTQKALYGRFTGISPVISEELCYRAKVDGDLPFSMLSEEQKETLYAAFSALMTDIREGNFQPNILYLDETAEEFSAVRLSVFLAGGYREELYDSISEVLTYYYAERAKRGRIRAKSEDIRHILKTLTERTAKKLDLWEKQFQDAEKKDKYRIYGELLNTYGYSLSGGEKELVCQNYYDGGREIKIPLDKELTAKENAQKYFDRYRKLQRTQDALSPQIEEAKQTLWHLNSIESALSIAENEADLNQLRREMSEYGFIKKTQGGKRLRKEELRSEPMHFVSSDGVDIYVGRNNYQNEELTFKLAEGNDWWFHAKNTAGSHVIAKTGSRELPDATCLEAAALAAYYSKACGDEKKNLKEKIEVDYVQKKALRRVPKAAPGYVIYHTNYSIMVEPKREI